MASGGHNRKPTALKLVAGTARPDRLTPNEPRPPLAFGAQPPRWLDRPGRDFWRRNAPRLVATGVLTEADLDLFAVVCNAWSMYRHAVTAYRGGTSSALTVHRCEATLRGLAADFGLHPVGRSRVSALPAGEADPFELFLSGGQRA